MYSSASIEKDQSGIKKQHHTYDDDFAPNDTEKKVRKKPRKLKVRSPNIKLTFD